MVSLMNPVMDAASRNRAIFPFIGAYNQSDLTRAELHQLSENKVFALFAPESTGIDD
jgi:hypothetical protein